MAKYSKVVDTSGLRCPLPLLKIRKDIKSAKKQDMVLVISDDPLAEVDIRHFCNVEGFQLNEITKKYNDKKQYFEIKC